MRKATVSRRGNPETEVLREITDRLQSMGYAVASPGKPGAVIRMAVGPVMKKHGLANNPLKGYPDLQLLLGNGRLCVIEVKRKDGGELSPEQRAWLKFLAARGVLCIVARSADYVEQIIRQAEAQAA